MLPREPPGGSQEAYESQYAFVPVENGKEKELDQPTGGDTQEKGILEEIMAAYEAVFTPGYGQVVVYPSEENQGEEKEREIKRGKETCTGTPNPTIDPTHPTEISDPSTERRQPPSAGPRDEPSSVASPPGSGVNDTEMGGRTGRGASWQQRLVSANPSWLAEVGVPMSSSWSQRLVSVSPPGLAENSPPPVPTVGERVEESGVPLNVP